MANGTDRTGNREAIGRTPLFGGLANEELEALASRASEKQFAKGDILFIAGEEARGLFVVVDGTIRTFRGGHGREQVIEIERAGATLGEVAIFDDGPYVVTAAADEGSTVLFIEKQHFQQFLLNHPHVALSALKLLARLLRRHAELVESLSQREVKQRLARFLLAEAQASGTRDEHGLRLELTLSKRQIASRVGTVREVIWRAPNRLEQQGLVEIEGQRLTILDETALEHFARKQGCA